MDVYYTVFWLGKIVEDKMWLFKILFWNGYVVWPSAVSVVALVYKNKVTDFIETV